jgi:uncharacterized protein YoaH (UPF0181 family)
MQESNQPALTAEQQRRIEIFERYNQVAGPVRDARNQAIEAFELEWREKSVQLFHAQEQRRVELTKEMTAKGVSGPVAISTVVFQIAKETEDRLIEKDGLARKLDESLTLPKRWREYLEEEAQRLPGDPVIATLLQEHSALDHDAGIDGLRKSPPPERLLSELSLVDDGKGITSFKRGMTTVFRDVGQRLDVQRVDNRDIEAALRVAAQKFDVDKGLLLTGDTAFKACAAEIAGRMGLKLRNSEPEVLAAWEKGRQQQAQIMPSIKPSVERGIAGDVREPGVDRARGEQILVVDPGAARAWGNQIEASGAEFVAGSNSQIHIRLPGDRTEEALAAWRGLPHETMQAFARADLSKPDGGLSLEDKDRRVLVERQMIKEDGSITPAGMDVILVRDDHVLRSRLQPELKQVFAPGAEIKTSHEFVRQAQGDLAAGQTHATGQEQSEKAKEFTQVKERTQERESEQQRDDKRQPESEREPEPEAVRQLRKRARSREQDVDFGL